MSLQTRLQDFITAVGTDVKQLRTWLTGSSSGTLASLTTTDKTSIVNAINEVKASATGAPPAATELQAGVAEVATQAEMTAGTADNVFVTPLKHKVDGDVRWQAKSTNLTNLSGFTTSTSAALTENSDTVIPTQKAVKAYADALIGANDAMVFKGVINASSNPNYPAANRGDTYRVSVAGKIGGASGLDVEVGDILIALTDGTAAGTHATVGSSWTVVQSNLDGAVTGPATSVAGSLATFSGTTGKVVADSGVSVSTDGTLSTNNNTKVPTEGAVRTYMAATMYTKTELGNPETDLVALYTTAKS